jgi:acetyl esterase/lipase
MKYIKKSLPVIGSIILLFILLMLVPKTLAWLYPGKPPIGYRFIFADYLAVGVGLEKLADLKPKVPEDIEEIRNVEYRNINGKSLQLDIYKPKNLNKPAPLLVFIHGGGWKSGQRSDYMVYLIPFAQEGYITATLSYRLLSDAPYPACAEDVMAAFDWIFRNAGKYGYDPDRVAAIGGSAGAHLAMLAGYGWHRGSGSDTTSKAHRIKAVVDIYGPVDLTTEYARNHPLVTGFISKSYTEAPELYKEASPVNYLDKDDPPTLILHGSSDDLVPVSQSWLLKHKLDSLGVPAELNVLPLWPHTMDIVERVNIYSREKISEFLSRYME